MGAPKPVEGWDGALRAASPSLDGGLLWLLGFPGKDDRLTRLIAWPRVLGDRAALGNDLDALAASVAAGVTLLGLHATVVQRDGEQPEEQAAREAASLDADLSALTSPPFPVAERRTVSVAVVDAAGLLLHHCAPPVIAGIGGLAVTTARLRVEVPLLGDGADAAKALIAVSMRLVLPTGAPLSTDPAGPTLREALSADAASASPGGGSGSGRGGRSSAATARAAPAPPAVLALRAALLASPPAGASSELTCPLLTVGCAETVFAWTAVLDVCALALLDAPCAALHDHLVLSALPAQLLAQVRTRAAHPTARIGAFHFGVASAEGLPVTGVFPLDPQADGEAAEALYEPHRRQLHRRFHVPQDRPAFRRRAALDMSAAAAAAPPTAAGAPTRLRDVHVGLPPSGVPGGTLSTVAGSYLYYHYGQDRVDDVGWGCSYRSFQTICSWFVLQNYSSAAVPTHRQAQQALVELGDKPASFVGSTDWIGSIELSYLLDRYYGVACKIMTLSSGSEFPARARELARHFETQGTPVMIGGGVLAYTLLGVDYNDRTGAVKFLILDPHYTGAENLRTIQERGWVGWKGPELFRADAFYNLCMPMRPQIV